MEKKLIVSVTYERISIKKTAYPKLTLTYITCVLGYMGRFMAVLSVVL